MPAPIDILEKFWGYTAFRDPQEAVIRSVLDGHDTLALLPTGGGKSLCFQVPGLMLDGICVVVSPLVALMKDQVARLKALDIKAEAIFSGMRYDEIDRVLDNAVFGYYKFLYVSPERLQTDIFRERFARMPLNLLVVDEAHCISQWGYDFRPPYLAIAEIRKFHPNLPVLALTASATPAVQQDIAEKLELKRPAVFKGSFLRENLAFVVRREEAKLPKLAGIIGNIKGSGLVYVRNRKMTKEVAQYLSRQNIQADFYHAGLSTDERSRKQEAWTKNKVPVMVCTNAFGMGIDKPDVRFVVHLDIPESVEAYYQEAGRAGRDGRKAYAILLCREADELALATKADERFPDVDAVKRVYKAICNYLGVAVGSGKYMTYDLDLNHFGRQFKFDSVLVYNSLKLLEQEGYLQLSDGVTMPSRLVFNLDKLELYKFEVKHADYDPLIKILLRTYGGIFDHYTKIDENALATRLKIAPAELSRQLKFLQKNGVITYIPASDKPTLTLLEERLPDTSLCFNTQYLRQRKKVFSRQLEAVLGYVREKDQCRQQYICSYLGDTVLPCGICDICLDRRHRDKHRQEFDAAKETLLNRIGDEWIPAVRLIPQKAHYRQELYREVLRYLLDEKQIILNDKNELKRVS